MTRSECREGGAAARAARFYFAKLTHFCFADERAPHRRRGLAPVRGRVHGRVGVRAGRACMRRSVPPPMSAVLRVTIP